MGDNYASAIGTTVMQLKETPLRPMEFDGALVLFGVKVGESEVMAALSKFGTINSCEVGAMTIVRFATHVAALAAKREGPVPGLCDGIDTLFNERSYDGRQGKEGMADDHGRGWCALSIRPPPVTYPSGDWNCTAGPHAQVHLRVRLKWRAALASGSLPEAAQ